MPMLERQNYFQLGFLLLIVPTQYLLTYYFNSTPSQKATNLKELKSVFSTINNYFELEYLKKWCSEIYKKIIDFNKNVLSSEEGRNEPSIKSEVPSAKEFPEHKAYFASSLTPRSPRPPHVKYKIGQVFRHRYHGYRGVIVGWDPETYAPDFWVREMYPEGQRHLLKLPSYSVLVDYRDKDKLLRTYVNEINVELLSGVQILNNEVNEFFESFDGTQYIPRPKLQKLYPHD